MKHLFLATLLLSFFSKTAIAQQNVLLVIADDFGTDWCGFYEDHLDTANMPRIRELLPRGVRFRNAWATPYCSSTRAGLLTGRYSFRTGVGTVIAGAGSAQLDTSEITIAKLLKYHAPLPYSTANIGKWHLNLQSPANLTIPNYMGYDHFEGPFIGAIGNYYNWNKVTNGVTSNVTTYATTATVNSAIAWLDTLPADKPFFLWLAFNAPHSPLHRPPAALHTVLGLTGTQMHINQNPKLYFRAMVEAMDTETGRLFDYLDAEGLLDSTNIIFIGDNGNAPRVAQNPDTSRVKGTLYEHGIHVPFVVAGPAVDSSAQGGASDALVSTPDLFATILEMAGFANWKDHIPPAKPVDSQSLLPLLQNDTAAVRSWIFTELFTPSPTPDDGKAIRNTAGYKLIQFDDCHHEFYHLPSDPEELTNLLLLPFDSAAAGNYLYLCSELSELVGFLPCVCDSISESGEAVGYGQGFRVFPNPGAGLFSVVAAEAEALPVEIRVADQFGRVVQRFRPAAREILLDLRGEAAGVYFVQVIFEKGRSVRRVVRL